MMIMTISNYKEAEAKPAKITKYSTTQYKKAMEIKAIIYDIYSRAQVFHPNFNELMEMKKEFKEHKYIDSLNQYYTGMLNGVDSTLFNILQSEWVEWLLYYTNRKGNVTYSKKWHRLPEEIKDSGNFHGNHFWKTKKRGFIGIPDEYTPTPFGVNPSNGVGRK